MWSVGFVIQILVSGVAIGLVYGLVALGYVTIYRTSGIVNLAQGEFVMLGALLSYELWSAWKWPLAVASVVTLVAVPIISLILYQLIVAPLRRRKASVLILVMSTLGFGLLIQTVSLFLWGSFPKFGPAFAGDRPITIRGVSIVPQHLWMVAVGVVLVLGLFVLTNRTRVGKAMTATATDPLAAGHVGIRTGSMIRLAFIISAFIGAAAGITVSSLVPFTVYAGSSLAITGFVAAVLGGWGKPLGAVMGGIVLGILQTFAGAAFSAGYKDAVALVVLLLVLYFRPSGIFGSSLTETAD